MIRKKNCSICRIPFRYLVLHRGGGKYKVMIIMEMAKICSVNIRSGVLLKV